MNELLEFMSQYGWSISLLLQVALGLAVLYLRDKFASKGTEKDLEEVKDRVMVIETKMDQIPSKEDFHSLDKAICELQGDLKRVDESLDGSAGLINRLELQVNRIDGFLRKVS